MDVAASKLTPKEVITANELLKELFGCYFHQVDEQEQQAADTVTLTLTRCVKQATLSEEELNDPNKKEYAFGYLHLLRRVFKTFNDAFTNLNKFNEPKTRATLLRIATSLHGSEQVVSEALKQIDKISQAASELAAKPDNNELIIMMYIQRMELAMLVYNLARRFRFNNSDIRALVQQIRLRSNQLYGTTAYETGKVKSQLGGLVGVLIFSLVATLRIDSSDMSATQDSSSRADINVALKTEKDKVWKHPGAKAACLLPAAVFVAQHRWLTREENRARVVLTDNHGSGAPNTSGDTKWFNELVRDGLHAGLPFFASLLASVDFPLWLR